MTYAILAFACGIWWLQLQAVLPTTGELELFTGSAAALLVVASLRPRLRVAVPIAAFLAGIVWAGMLATQRLDDALPLANEGKDVDVVGVIAEMPQSNDRGLRFRFMVESSSLSVPRHIQLNWYAPRTDDEDSAVSLPPIHAGERWHFRVRLKRPHGNLNPNGFDYEAWLFERGIRATGYVRAAPDGAPHDGFVPTLSNAVERLRENIRARYRAVLGERPYAGILIALSVGDQQAIPPAQWQQFGRTGLTHLMSISGLHITMVAGLFYWLVSWAWRRSSILPLRMPAQQAAAIGGFAAALLYCLVAGFAVPAQRTLYMLGVVLLAVLMRRRLAPRQILSIALLVVLVLDPWAVVAAGFWLSFGAVALLFYTGSGRITREHWLRQWGRAQWALLFGMLPLLLALFQQFSLVSPLANALAIPVVSFIVTPLTLLAALPGLPFLIWPAYAVMHLLMLAVGWLAELPWAMWQQHAPPLWTTLLALLGTAWVMLPHGVPARWIAVLLYLPLFLVTPPRPAAGEMKVTVLDVGQGLAIHVQTRDHDLVFDTGAAFSPDADSGTRVLLPYLRAAGVQHLDGLVVSHEDNDHAGGAASLLQGVPTDWMLSSLPAGHPLFEYLVRHIACSGGQHWQWDGVVFDVLHPDVEEYRNPSAKSNHLSCVLRIATARGSLLLTGDIEAVDERQLLARHADLLASDVLVAPHHGSNTSSSSGFLAAVQPADAIFAVGYRNRFGHPRPNIVARYRANGVSLYRSDEDGAVTMRFDANGIGFERERASRRRYWHGA